jgi:hypothetical protein
VSRGTRFTAGLAALNTAALLGMLLFSRFPWVVERWYVEGIGPYVQGLIAVVSGKVPLSLAEWVEMVSFGVVALWFGTRPYLWWKSPGARWAFVGRSVAEAWMALSAVGVLFYATWGLSYARPGAAERLGWVPSGEELAEIEPVELLTLGELLVKKANTLYLELHGWPDGFVTTRAPQGLQKADEAIDRGYERLARELGLHPTVSWGRGPSKPLLTSEIFSWLGIGGFYFPFTAEANINASSPEWQQGFTIAHEKGHQRFMASENEANFYGFLACIHSDDAFVQYSGWMFAQRQVLATLGAVDPWGFHHAVYKRHPGVQRDVDEAREFWARYDGPVSQIGDAVNDQYLRFNGVEGGIESYRQSISLVVEWLRRVGVN